MTTTGQHNEADIIAVMGASGSGKSVFIKGELRRLKPARLMVWDFKREYAEHGKVAKTLAEALTMARAKNFKIVFQPSHDTATAKKQFDIFCRIAFAAKRLTFVGEELAFVTSPGYAPPGWAMLILAGRSEGLKIYGASQRPVGIDKNFFGTCTTIRTGRLNYKNDIATMSDVLKVPREQVDRLLPLQFIQRIMKDGKTTTGINKIRG